MPTTQTNRGCETTNPNVAENETTLSPLDCHSLAPRIVCFSEIGHMTFCDWFAMFDEYLNL